MQENFKFVKAAKEHRFMLLDWLDKPHVRECWDVSEGLKNNIENYTQGKKQIFDFWVAYINHIPFAQIRTSDALETKPDVFKQYASKTGKTLVMAFVIGNEHYLGKGLASKTLDAFITFLKTVEPTVDTLIIAPATGNSRAVHVCTKTGFKKVIEFETANGLSSKGHYDLMVRSLTK